MTVTLKEIALAIERGQMALVGESAGYLILGAADAALKQLRLTELNTITLNGDGLVALCGPEADIHRVELSLRASLARLLSLCRREYPNLNRVAHRQEVRGLELLIGELEAALVPVNRKAARRSLGRLFREAQRFQAKEAKKVTQEAVAEKVAKFVELTAQVKVPAEPVFAAQVEVPAEPVFATQVEVPAEPVFATQVETPAEPVFMRTTPRKDEDRRTQATIEGPSATESLAGSSTIEVFEDSSFIQATLNEKETIEESLFEEVETTLFSPAIIESQENKVEEGELVGSTETVVAPDPSQHHELSSKATELAEAASPITSTQVQPLERMSIGAFGWVSNDKKEFREPLIAVTEEQAGKGYSLNELLDSAQPARPSSRLMRELRQLSEVDHSPAPPEVK